MNGSVKKRLFSRPDVWGQLLVVSTTVLLFMLGGIVSMYRRGAVPSPQGLAVFAVLCAGFLANALAFGAAMQGRWRAEAGHSRLRPVLLLLGISLALRLPQWGSVPRNDSSEFTTELNRVCRDFVLTPAYWYDRFALIGHPSHGLASLAAIPEFFFPGSMNNIWLFQTAVSLGVVYCLYDLFARELGKKSAFFGALLLGCSPMFLGLDSYFCMDFGSVFLFYTMWAFYRKKYVLLVWYALLLAYSKEFGIVLLVGFFLGAFLYGFLFAAHGGLWQRVRTAARSPRLVLLCLTCLFGGLGILHYIFKAGWMVALSQGDSGSGHLGANTAYIRYKLFQCLCVNFGWLAAAVLLLCLITAALRAWAKKGREAALSPPLKLLAAGSVGAGILYFVFSCAVFTATLPRYNLVLEMLLFFWAFLAAAAVFGACGRAVRLLTAAAAVLLTVQAYWTVDPVMHVVYPQVETGGIPLAYLNFRESDTAKIPNWLGDYIIYNAQYRYLDKCTLAILRAEHCDADTDIISAGFERGLALGGSTREYWWDIEKQTFTMTAGPSTRSVQHPLTLAPGDGTLQQMYEAGELHASAIILLPPSLQGDAAVQAELESAFPDFYTVVRQGEASFRPAGAMRYYRVSLLPPGGGE